MDKEELLKELNKCYEDDNTEMAHFDADELLIKYINDKEIAEAYDCISKWYS